MIIPKGTKFVNARGRWIATAIRNVDTSKRFVIEAFESRLNLYDHRQRYQLTAAILKHIRENENANTVKTR